MQSLTDITSHLHLHHLLWWGRMKQNPPHRKSVKNRKRMICLLLCETKATFLQIYFFPNKKVCVYIQLTRCVHAWGLHLDCNILKPALCTLLCLLKVFLFPAFVGVLLCFWPCYHLFCCLCDMHVPTRLVLGLELEVHACLGFDRE